MVSTDQMPSCPYCGGAVIFSGNESPDGRWITRWKHHFLCTACNRNSFKESDHAFDYIPPVEHVVLEEED